MTNCKVEKIGVDGCLKKCIKFKSNEDRMKTELSFTSDFDMQDFVKIGLSVGISKNKNSNVKNISICEFTNISKASLKFDLKPAPKFIEKVEDAAKSKSIKK